VFHARSDGQTIARIRAGGLIRVDVIAKINPHKKERTSLVAIPFIHPQEQDREVLIRNCVEPPSRFIRKSALDGVVEGIESRCMKTIPWVEGGGVRRLFVVMSVLLWGSMVRGLSVKGLSRRLPTVPQHSIKYLSPDRYCRHHRGSWKLWSSKLTTNEASLSSDDDQPKSSSIPSNETRLRRQELLQHNLERLDINATDLQKAVIQSMEDPTSGYDGRFGKSAIKTYRSFLYPKHASENLDDVQLRAAANRCARQISFLLQRHKSHQTSWVRHTDPSNNTQPTQRQTFFPLILVLDNVRSALNVGSLFRTADAAGCSRVFTTGITPHPHGNGHDKLQKTALGAELTVPHEHFDTLQQVLQVLRKDYPDYQIVGMETTEQSQTYTDLKFCKEGTVLVLGNEVYGVYVGYS